MAISNYLLSPTSENSRGFSTWFKLAMLMLTHAATHSQDRLKTVVNK